MLRLALVLGELRAMPPGNLAGSLPNLPDDAEEELLRLRRSTSPTPPIEEQLRWLAEE